MSECIGCLLVTVLTFTDEINKSKKKERQWYPFNFRYKNTVELDGVDEVTHYET